MLRLIRIFFEFEENPKPVVGFLSLEHIIYCIILVIITTVSSIFLAKYNLKKGKKSIHNVMVITTIIMLSLESLKIVLFCIRNKDPLAFLTTLPLFLCSMMLFAMPFATFSKNKLIKQTTIDFSFIFGPLCMLAGTFLAANYYNNFPLLSFSLICSSITHSLSGFFGLFCFFTKQTEIDKKRYLPYSIFLLSFEILALLADLMNQKINEIYGTCYEYNYMFFMNDAGTPFSIVTSMSNGNVAVYCLIVMSLYFLYLFAFIGVYQLIKYLKLKKVNGVK